MNRESEISWGRRWVPESTLDVHMDLLFLGHILTRFFQQASEPNRKPETEPCKPETGKTELAPEFDGEATMLLYMTIIILVLRWWCCFYTRLLARPSSSVPRVTKFI